MYSIMDSDLHPTNEGRSSIALLSLYVSTKVAAAPDAKSSKSFFRHECRKEVSRRSRNSICEYCYARGYHHAFWLSVTLLPKLLFPSPLLPGLSRQRPPSPTIWILLFWRVVHPLSRTLESCLKLPDRAFPCLVKF